MLCIHTRCSSSINSTDTESWTMEDMHTICVCNAGVQDSCRRPSVQWALRRNLPVLTAQFQGTTIPTLIDSGSMLPLLAENQYQQLTNAPKFSTETLNAFGCNGSELSILGMAEGLFSFVKGGTPFRAQFYILQNASSPCILPSTWLKAFHAVLDYNLLSLTYTVPGYDFLINAHTFWITESTLHQS